MNFIQINPKAVADEIFGLYTEHGQDDYIGEPVSQLEHMSQAAAIAQSEGYEEEVILAAFFHDIGHLCAGKVQKMKGYGNLNHEQLGADYLRDRGFSKRLVKLVKGHVAAKRYLTFKYPEYYDQLSPASKETLNYQGGIMSREEALVFEKDPDQELIIRMRFWDDQAKLTNTPVSNLQNLKEMTLRHLEFNIAR